MTIPPIACALAAADSSVSAVPRSAAPAPRGAADDRPVAVIGAGPAGLMAAEVIREAGLPVIVFDAMPSAARKFLLAGKGGLNLTHAEPVDRFVGRYGEAAAWLAPMLQAFGPAALRDWVHQLGIATFVGSSGRVFPEQMKAAPLLRAWLHRLRAAGVQFRMRHRWCGWHADGHALLFDRPATGPTSVATMGAPAIPSAGVCGPSDTAEPAVAASPAHLAVSVRATVLALGGASWPRLGSDAAWVPWLRRAGVVVRPLTPANCGFDVGWSGLFAQRFAGHPVKAVIAWPDDNPAAARQGEFVVTADGVEGSLVYHHAAALRDRLLAGGPTALVLDLAPGRSLERLASDLARPRGGRSLANHLRARAGVDGVKAGLLRERLPAAAFDDPLRLATAIKALPIALLAPRPLDEAISTAGGVAWDALDPHLMLKIRPGVFCAGEMLDWEAPTGGYLLTASFATGRAAGSGVVRWLSACPAKCLC